MNETLKDFFSRYEKAFAELDVETTVALFGEPFVAASPGGFEIADSEAVRKGLTGAYEDERKLGRTSVRMIHADVTPMDDHYVMAKIRWRVTYEKSGARPIEYGESCVIHISGPSPRFCLIAFDPAELMAQLRDAGLAE